MKITIEKEEVLELLKEYVAEKYGLEAVSCRYESFSSGADIEVTLKKKGKHESEESVDSR